MSENIENGIRLTIEAQEGETSDGRAVWSGTPGTITLSPQRAREAVEAVRAHTVDRLDFWMTSLLIQRHGDPDRPETKLDFSAPNQPVKEQIEDLLRAARDVVDALEVLHELAPWTYDGDDDEEPELDPEPDPAETRRA